MAEQEVVAFPVEPSDHKRKLENLDSEILEQIPGTIDTSDDDYKEASDYSEAKRTKLDDETTDGLGNGKTLENSGEEGPEASNEEAQNQDVKPLIEEPIHAVESGNTLDDDVDDNGKPEDNHPASVVAVSSHGLSKEVNISGSEKEADNDSKETNDDAIVQKEIDSECKEVNDGGSKKRDDEESREGNAVASQKETGGESKEVNGSCSHEEIGDKSKDVNGGSSNNEVDDTQSTTRKIDVPSSKVDEEAAETADKVKNVPEEETPTSQLSSKINSGSVTQAVNCIPGLIDYHGKHLSESAKVNKEASETPEEAPTSQLSSGIHPPPSPFDMMNVVVPSNAANIYLMPQHLLETFAAIGADSSNQIMGYLYGWVTEMGKQVSTVVMVPQWGTHQQVSVPSSLPEHHLLKHLEPLGWIRSLSDEVTPYDLAFHACFDKYWDRDHAVIATCSVPPDPISISMYKVNKTAYERVNVRVVTDITGQFMVPTDTVWNYNFMVTDHYLSMTYTVDSGNPKPYHHEDHHPKASVQFKNLQEENDFFELMELAENIERKQSVDRSRKM